MPVPDAPAAASTSAMEQDVRLPEREPEDSEMDGRLDEEAEREVDGYIRPDKLEDNEHGASSVPTFRTYEITPQVAINHPADVHCMTATRNMRWFFTGSQDCEIRMFDFFSSMNGKNVLPLSQRSGYSEPITKGGVLWSSWPLEEQPVPGQPTDPIAHPIKTSPVFSLDVHSEAHYLLAGCTSGAVNLYSVRHDEGVCQYVLRRHTSPVSCLKIAPGETSCFTGSWDKSLHSWDLNTGAVTGTFGPHSSLLTSLSFQPGASTPRLLSTTVDGQMYLWDTRITDARPHSPSEGALSTPRGLVRKFTVPPPGKPSEAKTPPWCMSACWSPDGGKVYVGRRNGTVDEFDVAEGERVRSIQLPRGSGKVTAVEAMGNGRQIACASQDAIRLYSLYDDDATPPTSITRPPTPTLPDDPLLTAPTVPFTVVHGHRGGTPVSQVLVDQTGKYMAHASGSRGWEEGKGGGLVVLYDVEGIV